MKKYNFYSVLLVDRNASKQTIKQAYYKLSRIHHPDSNATTDSTTQSLLNQAYEVLSNPISRAKHDKQLSLNQSILFYRNNSTVTTRQKPFKQSNSNVKNSNLYQKHYNEMREKVKVESEKSGSLWLVFVTGVVLFTDDIRNWIRWIV